MKAAATTLSATKQRATTVSRRVRRDRPSIECSRPIIDRPPPHSPSAPRHAAPVSAGELARARQAATRFLAGYLPFLYGRGSARSVDAVAPDLRPQLTRTRAQVTPVERRRSARIVALTTVGQAPGIVLATALVDDGGVTSYPLRLTVQRVAGAWVVSGVDRG